MKRLRSILDNYPIIAYPLLSMLIAFIIVYAVPSTDLTGFEGWYMHAHMWKYPELDTYLHIEDGRWSLLIDGEIAAQGKYVEQQEKELYKRSDPWKGSQYKYDFVSEEGVPYCCYFRIDHGYKKKARGKVEFFYKNKSDEKFTVDQEKWEISFCSTFVRIKEPKKMRGNN